jgi:hypothetical protein
VAEFRDPVFEKTSPNRSVLVIENERFVLACFRENSSTSKEIEKIYIQKKL